ncbi:hypothetical protein I541_0169 [Mycobacteroides abscessus]|nr:hypothetical protein I541_0169 [Mycobacteroides abscessus]
MIGHHFSQQRKLLLRLESRLAAYASGARQGTYGRNAEGVTG